ncbi:hypothetical protein GCM10008949_49730 [Deinococcus humi]|nr:hypothetical protein GCM10008949_49730 [Deinococcus humi]
MTAILSPGLQGIHNPDVHDTLEVGGPSGLRFLEFRRKLLGGDPQMRGIAAHASTHHPEMQELLRTIRPHLYTVHLLHGYYAALNPLLIEPETWTPKQREQVKLITDLLLTACLLEDVPDYRQHSELLIKAGLRPTNHQPSDDPLVKRVVETLEAYDAAQAAAPGNAPLERLLAEFSQQHPSF